MNTPYSSPTQDTDWILTLLFCKDSFDIIRLTKVDMPLNKETQQKILKENPQKNSSYNMLRLIFMLMYQVI